MRILVITHSYFPTADPRAFRWGAICEHWAKQGIVIDVVCANANSNLSPVEEINGVIVHRVGDLSYRFRSKFEYNGEATELSRNSLRTRSKKYFKNALKGVFLSLRWPDFAWLWIPRAYYRVNTLLKTYHYDGMYSVALPFSSHVVALFLGKKRKNIPWVSDYGDPFSFVEETPCNNKKLYDQLNSYVEQKVMQSSKKISVTTIETAQEYMKHLVVDEDRFELIPPLVRGIILGQIKKKTKVNQNTINLVYAGTLYTKIRNPKYLLELLAAVQKRNLSRKVIIHFYGSINDCANEFELYKEAINDWIFIHGIINREDLLKVYENTDVLVNIGNATSYQAPSKVIEYLSTGLPIFNIASISKDSSLPLLQSYPAAHSLYPELGITESIIDGLITFLEKKYQLSSDVINEIVKPYQCETIANAYLELLK